MTQVERYAHHGVEVSVVSAVKGQHRDHCLCFTCERFNPDDSYTNCPIAKAVYANCVKFDLVTPVYECPKYEASL
jgi:hypothetical protein